MPDQPKQPSSDERIARHARAWRRVDKDASANKQDPQKQRAEYRARQQLREAIDTAGQP